MRRQLALKRSPTSISPVPMDDVCCDRGRYVVHEQQISLVRSFECGAKREPEFADDDIVDTTAGIVPEMTDPGTLVQVRDGVENRMRQVEGKHVEWRHPVADVFPPKVEDVGGAGS